MTTSPCACCLSRVLSRIPVKSCEILSLLGHLKFSQYRAKFEERGHKMKWS